MLPPAPRLGLNEPATPLRAGALFSAGADHVLFVGVMGYLSPHALPAPVLVFGTESAFRIRIPGTAWRTCRAAVIPADTVHEMDFRGSTMAAAAVEGHVCDRTTLSQRLRDRKAVGPILVAGRIDAGTGGSIGEGDCDAREAWAWLRDWAFAGARRPAIDPRIANVLSRLAADPSDASPAADLAGALGLSESRFLHLFAEETHVPFRRYRLWTRLRAAARSALLGASLTDAALEAGFSDQAHLSRTFWSVFGVTPTSVLSRVSRAAWIRGCWRDSVEARLG